MRKSKFRTARCVIFSGGRVLMVVHSNRERVNRGFWGLPGGRIKAYEHFADAARREIREELHVALGELHEVGEYRYKGRLHKIVGTVYEKPIVRFDRNEILQIRWHTPEEVDALSADGRLHCGFEDAAVRAFLELLRR